jgi:hypothetical protein
MFLISLLCFSHFHLSVPSLSLCSVPLPYIPSLSYLCSALLLCSVPLLSIPSLLHFSVYLPSILSLLLCSEYSSVCSFSAPSLCSSSLVLLRFFSPFFLCSAALPSIISWLLCFVPLPPSPVYFSALCIFFLSFFVSVFYFRSAPLLCSSSVYSFAFSYQGFLFPFFLSTVSPQFLYFVFAPLPLATCSFLSFAPIKYTHFFPSPCVLS